MCERARGRLHQGAAHVSADSAGDGVYIWNVEV